MLCEGCLDTLGKGIAVMLLFCIRRLGRGMIMDDWTIGVNGTYLIVCFLK